MRGNNRELVLEQDMAEEQEKGHRERLRQRFLSTGTKGFFDYELLELLLTYTVIRKNCRGIAKSLLKKYGDLYTILKQPEEELRKNKYMTERAIVFFKLLFEIIESELYKKVHNKKITLSSNIKLLNYLKFSLLNRDVEVFKVLFLNTQNELLKEEELFYGTIDKSTVYIRELVKKILEYNAKAVILVHNHPSGSLRPSESDILLTRKVKEVFESLEIRLLDHLIISEKGYFSFLEGGIL
jgi:DNA repair protein radC